MIHRTTYRDLYNLHEAAETMTEDQFTAAVMLFVGQHQDNAFACNVMLEIVSDVCTRHGWK